MSDIILAARGVRKVFRNGLKEVRAVDGVDIDIKKNKSMSIIGHSGAGKSTLLHMLGGLERPTSGKVLLDDTDIYTISDNERSEIRNSRIGFVFQFYNLLPEFTALENVMMPAMIGGRGKGIRDLAHGILKSVGLEKRVNHRPGELSGGEAQRVAIGRALINEPEVLLCDEPTGNLDSKTRESIYELLFSLKAKFDMALVIVTHDEETSRRTDSTIRMKDGLTIK